MYPYIEITDSFRLPTYGLFAVIGIFAASVVAVLLCKKRQLSVDSLMSIALAAGLGLFIGAHILYGITNLNDIIDAFKRYDTFENFWEFIKYIFSNYINGMVFYGGLYGGAIAGFLWAKLRKYPVGDFGDLFAVITPLFHVFGRVGCVFAGCCYGMEASWGISGRVGDPEEMKRIPIQLFEAACLLLISALIFVLFIKGIARGSLFAVYLGIYAVARFILEFFRGDEYRGILLGLSTSQWISILTLLLVATYVIIKVAKRKKSQTAESL